MADKNLRFSQLRKILESFGLVVGVGKSGGQGSEAKISDPDGTRKISRIKKHGRNPQIHKQVVRALRTKFELSPDDGVTDEDFYSRG